MKRVIQIEKASNVIDPCSQTIDTNGTLHIPGQYPTRRAYKFTVWNMLLLLASIFFFISCSEIGEDDENDEDDYTSGYPPLPIELDFELTENYFSIDLYFDASPLADIPGELSIDWSISPQEAYMHSLDEYASIYFASIAEGEDITIRLSVWKGDSHSEIKRTITLPILSEVRRFGLGWEIQSEKSNNVAYEWYVNQIKTGPFSKENDTAASMAMALKWRDETSSATTEDIRHAIRPEGGRFLPIDLTTYFDKNTINYSVIRLDNINRLQSIIDEGDIALLNIETYYLRGGKFSTSHVGAFVDIFEIKKDERTIVVKGYKIVDGKTFYEVYDPGSDETYPNGQFKGKDRYYKAEELDLATNYCWDNALVIHKIGI